MQENQDPSEGFFKFFQPPGCQDAFNLTGGAADRFKVSVGLLNAYCCCARPIILSLYGSILLKNLTEMESIDGQGYCQWKKLRVPNQSP